MDGFSWLVEGELAAMPLPGRHRDLAVDAEFLRMEGVRTLVSLTETPPDAGVLAAYGIAEVHIPVRDFTAPTLEQMIEFVDVVRISAARGEPVGVHCTAGLGRSGTMAAAYLVARGASATEAIATVRRHRPGSIETEAQEAAVSRYETHLKADR
jgi:atypical dual specificity phosphatase